MQYSQYIWPEAAFTAGILAFVVATLLVVTRELHGRFSADVILGVQRNHRGLIPRVGGLAIVMGVLLGWYYSKGEAGQMLKVIVVSGALAFGFGFLEDLTKRVSVRTRLLATMGSGLLASAMSGVVITDVDVQGLDSLLLWTPFAVLFTAFAVGGVANAFNLIDGLDGLATGVGLFATATAFLSALISGNAALAFVTAPLAGALLGFLPYNFNPASIFMGDCGSN